MKSYFDNYIHNLPLTERAIYVESIQNLSHAVTRASMPDQALLRTWRETFGMRLHVGYGITEIGSSVMRTTNLTDVNLEVRI
jgi:acyl-CoA synthetase (AMP-forming)/AMP-acid ligase II